MARKMPNNSFDKSTTTRWPPDRLSSQNNGFLKMLAPGMSLPKVSWSFSQYNIQKNTTSQRVARKLD